MEGETLIEAVVSERKEMEAEGFDVRIPVRQASAMSCYVYGMIAVIPVFTLFKIWSLV